MHVNVDQYHMSPTPQQYPLTGNLAPLVSLAYGCVVNGVSYRGGPSPPPPQNFEVDIIFDTQQFVANFQAPEATTVPTNFLPGEHAPIPPLGIPHTLSPLKNPVSNPVTLLH